GVHQPVALAGHRGARRTSVRAALSYVGLSAGAVVMLVPFVWMLSTSLKNGAAVFVYPPQWLPDPVVWNNYADVVRIMPFLRYLLNTTFVSGSVTLLQLVVSSLAAFAFARLRFP